jgi:hypothetical protein
MPTNHPITPPSELVQQWFDAWAEGDLDDESSADYMVVRAAQWGADQELEACCEWLDRNNQWARVDIDELRDGRRPKPASLKEDALAALHGIHDQGPTPEQVVTIRRALEALPE